jgi:hypothetical protein
MNALDRRRFLQTIATAVPAGAAIGALQSCARGEAASGLDGETLDAVAEAVLPSELGPDGMRRAVLGFRQWLAAYQPAAELNHGYGTAELDYTPAHPGPGWTAQLEALDLEAIERHGTPFARLDRDARVRMIRAAIERDRADRLGDPVEARHVAVGLLAHFYGSPEAANLCYRAAINPYQCRPLATAGDKPAWPGS